MNTNNAQNSHELIATGRIVIASCRGRVVKSYDYDGERTVSAISAKLASEREDGSRVKGLIFLRQDGNVGVWIDVECLGY